MVVKKMTGKKARQKGDMPFAQNCTHAGIRMTSLRQLLATVLEEAADQPDVETIYLRCKEQDSSLSIASIYQSLGILKIINSSRNLLLAMARQGLKSNVWNMTICWMLRPTKSMNLRASNCKS